MVAGRAGFGADRRKPCYRKATDYGALYWQVGVDVGEWKVANTMVQITIIQHFLSQKMDSSEGSKR